ncbi:hypothetical protein VP01_4308g1 [Puccinia sorghi]|uniref:Retrotransposon gag domain-containing protein n=1 Tax=Puccinia sorghi TaxID=27349 RepID=A0A0L6US26_9BASI|nr:hypothetical protein VP01_4308g1 [Puccinia sorghi]
MNLQGKKNKPQFWLKEKIKPNPSSSSSKLSTNPAVLVKFCTLGMKPPDNFNGENSAKLQGFLRSREAQWFEPYLDLLDSTFPSSLIKNWYLFKQQLFTLFGDPNEVQVELSFHEGQGVHLYFPVLIGTMPPSLSISEKGFQVASQINFH